MILIIYKIQRDIFIDARENYSFYIFHMILHHSSEFLISACFEIQQRIVRIVKNTYMGLEFYRMIIDLIIFSSFLN